MLPPGKLARKAVRVLFRGKAVLVPGLLNCLALPFIGLDPAQPDPPGGTPVGHPAAAIVTSGFIVP